MRVCMFGSLEVGNTMGKNRYSIYVPSSVVTCLDSVKSILLPTSIIITSSPRSPRTSWIHFLVFKKELRSVTSYTCMCEKPII